MNENNEQKLNNIRKEKFDIFKLCVDEASKISDRRMKNNQFFIVINGAILSALITFFSKIDDIKTCIALIVASVFGMFLSKVNFHSKCKILGGVTEFFGKAFLCRFPPENLPRPVVYSVHSLPIQVTLGDS